MAVARTAGNFALWTTNTTASPNCAVTVGAANFGLAFGGWRDTGTVTISSATWNGSAMTWVGSAFARAGPRMVIDLFSINNPTTGNVVFNASAALGGAGNDGVVYAHAFSGVDIAGTPLGTAQDFDAVNPFSSTNISVPSAAAGDMAIDFVIVNGITASLTAGGSQTAYGLASTAAAIDANSSSLTGTGSLAMSWAYTLANLYNAMQRGILIKAAAAASGSLLIRPRGMGGGIQGLQGGMNS